MTEIVGVCLSQFHDDENSFELLLAYADGREIGHLVNRTNAQRIAQEFANEFTAALSSAEEKAVEVKKPEYRSLPGDVAELVIAAREFWQANEDMSEESRALDKALEAFSQRVPYENDPESVSAAAEAYVQSEGYEHSGGIIERAFEAGAEFGIRSAVVDVPAAEEPVAWMFEGDGWGREVMLSEQEAIDRKERLSRTWDITITPLYAHPPRSSLIQSDEGWRPIETAPKDGTNLLLWQENWLHPVMGRWSAARNGWVEYGSRDIKANVATHFRPLPTPPSPYGGDNGDGSATGTSGGDHG